MRLWILTVVVSALAVTSCDRIREIISKPEPPLPGRRQSVLPVNTRLEPDRTISDVKIVLPRPATNTAWPQASGFANHAMHHLTLGKDPKKIWSVEIGRGSTEESRTLLANMGLTFRRSRRLLAQPVMGGGRVYAMDAGAEVSAYSAATGQRIWKVNPLPKGEREGDLGGGVAFSRGTLYVTTGAAEVVAMDAATGKDRWRANVRAPVRGAPTVAGGRVYVVTVENEVVALDQTSGKQLWNYAGAGADIGILSGASPAVDGDVVVAPQTSGELLALWAETGRLLWSESVAATRRRNPTTSLTTIGANPIIDRGVVFAVSNAGRLVAIDLRSGRRMWDVEVGSLQTPWVAGDYVYILTNRRELAAITRKDGKVRWSIRLSRFVDDQHLIGGEPEWAGPVLASDRLIIAGTHGEALSVSPYTGEVIGWLPLTKGVRIQPVVAANTILFLDNNGQLTAMK